MLVVFALLVAAVAADFSHLYARKGRSDSTQAHPVTLFVKLDAAAAASCPKFLDQVSNPKSSSYGKHWSFEAMRKFASPKAFEATLAYLQRHGVSRSQLTLAPNMEFITVDASVGEIERAFGVELHDFEHKENSAILVRRPATTFAVPAELVEHVDMLSGLDALPYRQDKQTPVIVTSSEKRQAPTGVATPQLLWSYYGVSNRTIASQKASQAIFASLGQSFDPADLVAWQRAMKLPSTKFQHVKGQNDPSSCSQDPNNCIEASLDVQQITATAQGGDNTFWSIPSSAQDIFLAWTQAMIADKTPPLVTSISYGSLAPEDPNVDKARFASEACKLGLRGVTIIVASGDDGVANFGARSDPTQCGFTPSYPATCPYVTAVGATQGPEVMQPEILCAANTNGGITSGGGFSVYYALPDWQADAVNNYVNDPSANLPPMQGWNASMRAYPDVAIMGHNYGIEIGGQLYYGSGTSASSPVFAAMITLINGVRLSKGKSPVGFLNPALYDMGSSANYDNYFNDVTSGINNCCAGDPSTATCCQYGFTCTTGWDPASGLGSPKFGAFSKYLINLP